MARMPDGQRLRWPTRVGRPCGHHFVGSMHHVPRPSHLQAAPASCSSTARAFASAATLPAAYPRGLIEVGMLAQLHCCPIHRCTCANPVWPLPLHVCIDQVRTYTLKPEGIMGYISATAESIGVRNEKLPFLGCAACPTNAGATPGAKGGPAWGPRSLLCPVNLHKATKQLLAPYYPSTQDVHVRHWRASQRRHPLLQLPGRRVGYRVG